MIDLANTPVLETERLTLRAPKGADWPVWRDFYMTDRAQYCGGGADITLGHAWRSFGHVIGHWAMRGYGSFVFTLKGDDAPLGMTGPWHPADWPETEIGWTVWTPEAEGKGYAFEAAHAARDFARNTLGWTDIVSYIDPANARSIALAERLGATVDPDAVQPKPEEPCLVFRHPKGAV
ncbi:MAG TPA: GNAT family N-acetyltransferase [Paracoccus sp. (in: a-proteobacteria)]|uniref:GNAT family N-acetyltransferase n=1 Tax=uncultured Paracoccus sp. TaxID=189685 RepID=UPI00260AD9E3|nr:GNAT family N-acetyltransferase [uncultured Paracoccus sp.]HMQ40210.1 GNAT family N-acetyltransferase [Paracoccus sp. (in: a-proteobacteria)]HMR35863.1 GNAT family N-acetyltransferase [Paracoccus sp. (in: a-proteobacteria)]